MDILGIGVPELAFIIIIALIVLGPKDMQKAGKTLGSWLNKIVKSEEWKGITTASRKLKTLPNELMREANLEELRNEFGEFSKQRNDKAKTTTFPSDDYGTWGGRPAQRPVKENSIAPPAEAVHTDDKSAPTKTADSQPENQPDNTAPVSPDSDNA